jgi:hypothetical protein
MFLTKRPNDVVALDARAAASSDLPARAGSDPDRPLRCAKSGRGLDLGDTLFM